MSPAERELRTVGRMIRIYCRHHHRCTSKKNRTESFDDLCPECSLLFDYASKRLDSCKFGSLKPACEACPIHCYKPEKREQIRQVMRFAGPRMLFHHPIDALRHLMQKSRSRR